MYVLCRRGGFRRPLRTGNWSPATRHEVGRHLRVKEIGWSEMRAMDMDIEKWKTSPANAHAGETIYTEAGAKRRETRAYPWGESCWGKENKATSNESVFTCTCRIRKCYSCAGLYHRNRCFTVFSNWDISRDRMFA